MLQNLPGHGVNDYGDVDVRPTEIMVPLLPDQKVNDNCDQAEGPIEIMFPVLPRPPGQKVHANCVQAAGPTDFLGSRGFLGRKLMVIVYRLRAL